MIARKAARVFPDPVGAAIRTCCCAWMAGQACSCGAVAASNVLVNQFATAGWKEEREVTLELTRQWFNRQLGGSIEPQEGSVERPPVWCGPPGWPRRSA